MSKGELSEREVRLLEAIRQVVIPFGEVLVRLHCQDGVVVRLVVEERRESIKV